jgi:general secretion pathway protein B
MSYILDALTKAAQQRDQQASVVQRLLSPAPRPRSTWSYTSGRLLAALALNAVLLSAVLLWWLRPVPITAPPEPVSAPTPTAVSPRPLVRLEPPPTTDTKVETPPSSAPEPSAASAVTSAKPSAPPPSPRAKSPTVQPTPAPASTAPPPVAATRPAAPQESSGLRLEALIYADVPAERMVFINGRRYREGDSIEGRLRIEEIREDGVELSDQGRRFTLRISR